MGVIIIKVPQDIKLEYEIENSEATEELIRTLKGIKNESKELEDDVVGIWKDRFNENIDSGDIQRKGRKELWKRY